jgi:hypothetical protein
MQFTSWTFNLNSVEHLKSFPKVKLFLLIYLPLAKFGNFWNLGSTLLYLWSLIIWMQLENTLNIGKDLPGWPTTECSPVLIWARGHPVLPAHHCAKPARAHLATCPNGQHAPVLDRPRTRPRSRRWTPPPLPTTPMCVTHSFTHLILCTIPSVKETSFSSSSSRSQLRLCSAASICVHLRVAVDRRPHLHSSRCGSASKVVCRVATAGTSRPTAPSRVPLTLYVPPRAASWSTAIVRPTSWTPRPPACTVIAIPFFKLPRRAPHSGQLVFNREQCRSDLPELPSNPSLLHDWPSNLGNHVSMLSLSFPFGNLPPPPPRHDEFLLPPPPQTGPISVPRATRRPPHRHSLLFQIS